MADEPVPRPPKRGGGRCPVCGKPAVARHRPFCSARCAQLDLGRWLSGGYAIPGEPASPEEDDETPR
jgi:endogenous inhibitor of DNA gyrase (YacG/DUF329 family)